jgi:ATP-dependent Lon protease
MTNDNRQLPLLPLRGLIVFPSMVLHLDVGREKSIAALEKAMMNDHYIFLAAQKKVRLKDPEPKDIYRVGTVSVIKQMIKLPNGTMRVLVEGIYRGEIVRYVEQDQEFIVDVDKLPDVEADHHEQEALKRSLLNQFKHYSQVSQKITNETFETVADIDEPGRVADIITSHLSLKITEKQTLLEIQNIKKRLQKLIRYISNEQKVLDLEKKIGQRVKTSMEKTQKEYYLREQLKAIQRELGESDGKTGEVGELKEKIDQSTMPDRIRAVALKELDRYEKVPQSSAESSVIRNYIEWLLALPWTEKTNDTIEIKRAEEILNKDHYGLDKVKERG